MEPANNKKLIMAAIMVSMFLGPFLGTSVNLCIPNMEVHFGVDAATIGWTVTAYSIAMAAFSLPLGKVADLTSHVRVFQIGLAIVTVSSVACGFAADFAQLMACRIAQAFGAGMLNGTSIPIAVSLFPPTQRGKTIGICTSAVYVGGSMGPVLGGFLSSFASWSWVFWCSAMVAAVSLALSLFSMKGMGKNQGPAGQIALDAWGSMLYLASIALFLVGLTSLTTLWFGWIIMAAGIAVGIVFVLAERSAKEPVLRLSMFTQDRIFALSNLAALLNYGSVAALAYLLSIYFQSVLGISALYAGFILLVQPVIQAVVAPLAGSLSDKMAPWKISTLGMACSCCALAFFAFLQPGMPMALVLAVLAVAGFGFGIFASPNTNVIMGRVPKSEFGSANAIVSTMRTVGQAASMSVVTIIMGSMLGNMTLAQATSAQLMGAIHMCFAVFALVCALGIACSAARGRE